MIDRLVIAECTPGSNQYGKVLHVFSRTQAGFRAAHNLASQLGRNVDVFCEHAQWRSDGTYGVASLRVGNCGCDSPY